MSNFLLEILTPEHYFFQGEAESLRFSSMDGQLCILKGYCPMLAAIPIGQLFIRLPDNGEVKNAFNSEGFIEVRPDRVLVFVQSCEWPGEIDIKRARDAAERAKEKLRQKQSIREHKHTQISLTRAMQRLSLSDRSKGRFD